MGLAGQLQQRAAGAAPSVAENQLRQGMDAQIAAQHAQAASATGLSPGAAARLAANNIAGAQQATNAQAATLRAGEQAQAEQSLGQVLAGARGQDVSGAQLGLQAGTANQQAELQNRAQMDQATQNYISMGMSREQADAQARMDLEKLNSENNNALNTARVAKGAGNAQANASALGGVVGAAGGLIGGLLSDARAKENVSDASEDVDGLLSVIKPRRFDYKREHGGGKDYVGFMAQDLEGSALGKLLVKNSGDGLKRIDTGRALMAAMAGLGRLNARVRSLEGGAR